MNIKVTAAEYTIEMILSHEELEILKQLSGSVMGSANFKARKLGNKLYDTLSPFCTGNVRYFTNASSVEAIL